MTRTRHRFGLALCASVLAATPAAALPFDVPVFGGSSRSAPEQRGEAPVILAQSGDVSVRISQMEDEMRRLTGKVEEMSFLVLQLQEQLRSTQADNDLRFQDLEGNSGGATTAPAAERRSDVAPASAPISGSGDQAQQLALPSPATTGSITASTSPAESDAASDDIASILQGATGSGAATSAAPASQTVASVSANGPVELYSLAYNYLLAGDYHLAEQSFRQYTQTYPDSEDSADANYWLGESLFAQNKYRDAAEIFHAAQKNHPQSGKAPEMMLKLGMSLARLDNRDTACVTYAEVERRYPQMSDNVKRRLTAEESSANCS